MIFISLYLTICDTLLNSYLLQVSLYPAVLCGSFYPLTVLGFGDCGKIDFAVHCFPFAWSTEIRLQDLVLGPGWEWVFPDPSWHKALVGPSDGLSLISAALIDSPKH